MRRIASYATNEIIPSGAKRQVRNREVVSCTFLKQMDKHFERHFDRFMFWSLGITVSCAVFVVNYLKWLARKELRWQSP